MDVNIWEKTLITWLNSLSSSLPIASINEVNDCLLKDIVKKINSNQECSVVVLLKELFPNLTDNDELKPSSNADYLCVLTLLLSYVSLTHKAKLNDIKQLMCSKLDTGTQLKIVQFLTDFQIYMDSFNFSFKQIKEEIFPQIFINFNENHSINNSKKDNSKKTPIKSDSPNLSYDSPLQGFFQTPKKNNLTKRRPCNFMCGDGDHLKRIKQLSDQLTEEEVEKASLYEKLEIQTQKCNEFEMKLKNKLEEINHLKEEWDNESKKNDSEVNTLKNKILNKIESEKKLKNDLKNLENYISTLETDVSKFASTNSKLENQLRESLEKFAESEAQLKETTELCIKLQSTIAEKEKELEQLKDNYSNFFGDEKTIDVSFTNRSFDKSICSPENLGVITEKLLSEKIEENSSLKETIELFRREKNNLIDELNSLKKQLTQKCSVVLELEFLNKEINGKVTNLEKSEKELHKTQKELLDATAAINKLNKENSHLTEKYNILNNTLQQREKILLDCKNSRALLQINFLKLAEDFKAVQQRLEMEVKNISKLISIKEEESSILETDLNSATFVEGTNIKSDLPVKSSNNSEIEQKGMKVLDEITSPYYFSVFSNEKLYKLAELLQNFESEIEWSESKASLQKTCSQLNDSIIILKAKIRELEDNHLNNLNKKLMLRDCLKEKEEKLMNIQCENSSEIKKLKEEIDEKGNKIKELESLLNYSEEIQKKMFCELNALRKEEKDVCKKIEEQNVHNVQNVQNVQNAKGDGDNASILKKVSPNIEEKLEVPSERQEFSDSLEEVPVTNKTFDIVNLEEKNINNKTFSIKKENVESINKSVKSESAWVISPPSKISAKISSKEIKSVDRKRDKGESWVVPIEPAKFSDYKIKKTSSVNDLRTSENKKILELQKEVAEFSKECERLKSILLDMEHKRRKEKENFEKNQELIRRDITAKYENQLEHLKIEMKQLYNRELNKHKEEQSSLCCELRDQNKRYKEHIDELRNQLWDLREKLLHEQTLKRDLERNHAELKEKYENLIFSKESEPKCLQLGDVSCYKEFGGVKNSKTSVIRQVPNATFPTIPTEDEEEVFDNRFLEDMKAGVYKTERPEERLKELQYRNSLCLPHLKSSYPGETQFHNPSLFKETDLKLGLMQFPPESQSLTDSDQSMTKSLLPDNKGKKKEQTSYKRPGPPTPSKNGGRLSFQSGDLRLTPRNVLKEVINQNDNNRGTPNPLKLFLSSRNAKSGSFGVKDENTAPVTPRKKKFFRKPFGARDH